MFLTFCSAITSQRMILQVTTVGNTCLKALDAIKREWTNLQPKLWPRSEAAFIQAQIGEPLSLSSAHTDNITHEIT